MADHTSLNFELFVIFAILNRAKWLLDLDVPKCWHDGLTRPVRLNEVGEVELFHQALLYTTRAEGIVPCTGHLHSRVMLVQGLLDVREVTDANVTFWVHAVA